MSISYVPNDRDIAQYSKFKLNFDRLPNMTFFCKNVNLPGIINNAVRVETPFSAFLVPGDKTEFNTLEVNFLVDVNYTAWIEVFNWITALTFPKDFEQYQNLQNTQRTTLVTTGRQRGNQYSDAIQIAIIQIFASSSKIAFRSLLVQSTSMLKKPQKIQLFVLLLSDILFTKLKKYSIIV
jgi:hypothetical protein